MTVSLSFKSWEKDVNLDGKYDSLHFNIEVPLADSEAIHSVQLLLIFDYQLHVSEILNLDSTGHPRGEVVGGGGLTWVNFCWVCAAAISESLPHYSLFCAHIIHPILVTLRQK